MVSVKLYVEGGGDSEALHAECRQGFRTFLEKAGFKKRMPRIVACGGRRAAYDRFRTACGSNETALLLIDSEDFVMEKSPWQHLAKRPGDGFAKPENVADDHCHLMVVCMESWFLADKEALARFFGTGFKATALPQNPNVEAARKEDIYARLERATARCEKRGPYGKGKHSFKILCLVAPDKAREASPWAKRFVDTLAKIMGE